MSLQTGRSSLPPPSSRRIDLARTRLRGLRDDPNPVWMRELRQAARLQRTPIILAVVTGMMTLLMASVGGVASTSTEPAKVGIGLYHTFFSVAFFVVTWIGPTVAASTIASERSGRTWEALLLTGIGAPAIARGKLLASLTYVGLYIVMLAPVGALPFLFGGVTATEVFAAFALLGLFAVLSVAFGLSMSSKFTSNAAAVGVTLLIAVPLSIVLYLLLGVALSFGAHELWPGVPGGPPVWLPTAYARADFGAEYLVFLVAVPVVLVLLPAWFLYEVTIANMAGVSDDRSSGLRRWFLVCLPLLSLAGLAPAAALPGNSAPYTVIGLGLVSLMCGFAVFVFVGEPLGPSRRVEVQWERERASRLRRFLGPGLIRAMSLLLLLGLAGLAFESAVGLALAFFGGRSRGAPDDALRIASFGGYAMCFTVFLAGLGAWLRARAWSAASPRVVLAGALFLSMAGPWILTAIFGLFASHGKDALLVAAPSPTFVFVMMKAIGSPSLDATFTLIAGGACAAGWALIGVALFAAAARRARRTVRAHEDAMSRLEDALREEDEARDAQAAEPTYAAAAPSEP